MRVLTGKNKIVKAVSSADALDVLLYAWLSEPEASCPLLQPFVRARLDVGISPGTINRDLAVVRRTLNLSARLWRDASDQSWLETPPLIQMLRHPNKRALYPLSKEEERLLFSELAGHLARMALFKVNTGLREQEVVVNLRWS